MSDTRTPNPRLSNSRLPLLDATQSLCPFCLRVIQAEIVEWQGQVYMYKTCPADGPFEIYLWPSAEHYQWFNGFSFPAVPGAAQTTWCTGCPTDCGLCSEHRRRPTLVEIEVTRRCNLACPVCFMSARGDVPEIRPEEIEHTFQQIVRNAGTGVAIQLTGGEPTVRRDLAEIVRRGRELGLTAMEVNTNGIALARDPGLARSLRAAGLTGIYLQFDGLDDATLKRLRGVCQLDAKRAAIRSCRAAGLQVVLAATVIAGVNDHELGSLLDFALENSDVVCGLALQPAFESGRFEVYPVRRLGMGDVIHLLAAQSRGRLRVADFWPLGCSHPLCSCGTLLAGNGPDARPITRDLTRAEYAGLFGVSSPQGSVFADIHARRFPAATERGLSILIMNYMDAWTIDLERLKECSMTVATPGGHIVPFCAYHLTGATGCRLYAPEGAPTSGGRA